MVVPTKDAIRARALELGFGRCGFAVAGRAPDADRFDAWLAAGNEADLEYMRRDPARRADATKAVPGCRSVIVLTLDHFTPDEDRRAAIPAEVARYARGRDYHRVGAVMLRKLKVWLGEQSGGGHHHWYVDDGPVLERSWAVAAGIGFAGRNACVVDPARGSWFLLSVILTTLEIEPDAPVRESCGTCNACLPACPTGAIVSPGVIDARRCISYWTIEQRGAIPHEIRRAMGTRVFGCDDCQLVCPWNRFAPLTPLAELRPRPAFADADLLVYAAWSREEFDLATEGSPIRRAGYSGFLRNVAVALGNVTDPRAVAALTRLAAHDDPLVASHAKDALAGSGGVG